MGGRKERKDGRKVLRGGWDEAGGLGLLKRKKVIFGKSSDF